MAENSKIEWTDHTVNFWEGCTKVSPACDNCYAEARASRFKTVTWGHDQPRRLTAEVNWKKPYKWERQAGAFMEEHGRRQRVFANSLSDWADKEVPDRWRRDMLNVVEETPNLDWLLLSKRHALLRGFLPREPLSNVRIGVTVENDKMARLRLPVLRALHHAGWKTFVSYEPALGPVDWAPWMDCIGWAIAGGESGPGARPADPQWMRALRDQCQASGVPFFFKQWGDWDADALRHTDMQGRCPPPNMKIGKKRAGHLLDGKVWRQFPQEGR